MNTKKIIMSAALLFATAASYAQECAMPLAVQLDDDFTNVPVAAKTVLYQSLQRIVTNNGMATESPTAPFVLTAHCDVLDKSNLSGPPIQTVYNLGLTLYIADTNTRQKFATAYITMDGVGTGEVKAYINAFKRINVNSQEIKDLVNGGKARMLKYYDTQYGNILKEAKRLEGLQQYEEALLQVSSIPVCSKGYDKAADYCSYIYGKNLDRLNLYLLNAARALWAAGQDQQTAYDVCAMLAQIDPEAKCFAEAAKLMAEVKKQVRSDIDFEMREKYNDAVKLEEARIEAARAVGVAWGNGQKPKTTNLMWLK